MRTAAPVSKGAVSIPLPARAARRRAARARYVRDVPVRRVVRIREDALVHLEQARRLAPRDPQVFVLLGAVYQSANRPDEAISAYEKYLKLAPKGRFARELKSVVSGLKARKN